MSYTFEITANDGFQNRISCFEDEQGTLWYVGIDFDANKIAACYVGNTGTYPIHEMDFDPDFSIDENLQSLVEFVNEQEG